MDLIEKTHNHHRHPWELSRSYSILKFLQKNNKDTNYADLGAGDQFFTTKLKTITGQKIYAVDTAYPEQQSIADGIISLSDITHLEDASVDYFVVMDLLEHIENDEYFLNLIADKLKPGGHILITVPAMQLIFSSHDVFLKHYRRYNKKQLKEKISRYFIVEKSFYFYSSLLFLRIAMLLFEKVSNKKFKNVGVGLWKYNETSLITRFFYTLLNIDFWICKTLNAIHINLPGLSLLAIGTKKRHGDQ